MERLLLGVVWVASAAAGRPVFDYTFASNCPLVRNFSNTTFRTVFEAAGIAEAVDFRIHAAIRPGKPPHADDYECVLEKRGCPMTRLMLCVFDATEAEAATAKRMEYFACWNDLPVIYPQHYGLEMQNAHACAARAELDWGGIRACSSGSRGSELLKSAAESFVQRFPRYARGEQFGVPHVEIDEVTMGPHGWARYISARTYIETLCAKGIRAGACKTSEAMVV
mmetsp:Transcript_19266/g.57864  ORF Transcript_19266/g.57864 Transcript_19266/m.57864 type:complete len:224 (+) Transcript_19266:56-727(+)|eukprot:CAMPEP_0175324516 /NCGR_PEP_ID=MMETSP0093-20121207/73529_1 /TAXON_ID=311494 /ORGANISM="Alexandrium monilatum, Strain CCMP3105" /LENGTH=223 /DNA_ID=CAMNT_0016621435 /DNA_START=49 /DNA_END=720 /DNA_ORIENTATION=-